MYAFLSKVTEKPGVIIDMPPGKIKIFDLSKSGLKFAFHCELLLNFIALFFEKQRLFLMLVTKYFFLRYWTCPCNVPLTTCVHQVKICIKERGILRVFTFSKDMTPCPIEIIKRLLSGEA